MSPTGHVKNVAAADKVGVPAWVGDRDVDGRPFLRDSLQPVLTIRRCVEPTDVPAFVRDALHEIRAYIEDHHVEVRGEPFSICHTRSPDGVDVEVGWPVTEAAGTERISSGALPLTLVRGARQDAQLGVPSSIA